MEKMHHDVLAKGILSAKNGMNIYRGCTHGCIYCDSRSKCYNMKHDFCDIEVKINAPQLLAEALSRRRKRCMIGTGAMSDPYLQLEKSKRLTRECLQVIEDFGFGVTVLTKSSLVLRDIDLLEKINKKAKAVVQMTLTTYDEKICRKLEPNVAGTRERFMVLKEMQKRGIPTVVWLDPILPFINDTRENLEGILGYCIEAGVKGILCFGMGMTLRDGNREYFYENLDKDFLGLKEKYIQVYKGSYQIDSPHNGELMKIFREVCVNNRILCKTKDVFNYIHSFPEEKYEQLTFDFF